MATGLGAAQQTTSYTNRRGDTVTDTHSLQNGQYTNDRTVTAPNGNARTNDFTASRNSNGRLVISTRERGRMDDLPQKLPHMADTEIEPQLPARTAIPELIAVGVSKLFMASAQKHATALWQRRPTLLRET
jgi:hypothetical protein